MSSGYTLQYCTEQFVHVFVITEHAGLLLTTSVTANLHQFAANHHQFAANRHGVRTSPPVARGYALAPPRLTAPPPQLGWGRQQQG